jgi:hypothetical protein
MTISSRLDGFAEGWSVDEPQRRAFVDLSLGSRMVALALHVRTPAEAQRHRRAI